MYTEIERAAADSATAHLEAAPLANTTLSSTHLAFILQPLEHVRTMGRPRQIRHTRAWQPMKIAMVPWCLRRQGKARSFYRGPLAACRLYVRHRPLIAHSNFVT